MGPQGLTLEDGGTVPASLVLLGWPMGLGRTAGSRSHRRPCLDVDGDEAVGVGLGLLAGEQLLARRTG